MQLVRVKQNQIKNQNQIPMETTIVAVVTAAIPAAVAVVTTTAETIAITVTAVVATVVVLLVGAAQLVQEIKILRKKKADQK